MARVSVIRPALVLALLTLPATLPGEDTKVGFRNDHTILVGGKPFFPIGLYYCYEEFDDAGNKLLRQLRDYGFNTLGYYRWGRPGWQDELKRADQLGFKVWIRGHDGFALDTPAAEEGPASAPRLRGMTPRPPDAFLSLRSDEQLVRLVHGGNERAFVVIVERSSFGALDIAFSSQGYGWHGGCSCHHTLSCAAVCLRR